MTTLQQELQFSASPQRVYETLVDADAFSAISGGAPTAIDSTAGGEFSCFGGMIHGRTIEAIPGERLVQAWRAKPWPEGVYSIVRMEFEAAGEGSALRLVHAGFPEGQAEHLAKGWHQNYWQPLARSFELS